ncbi:PhzF family phenazine biosynthesis isomerase [Geodermatophilus dictyosporus]|uniref:PhzF family phenazine biosynthesis isomerase n=1 Tax=Geodermatophilus dictyosporus TaxID=1523247 RepID=UPI00145C32E3|nr:PhzF family phenazine biosynthesis isomerase [Geodermatophilus dictyosporus]
MTPSSDDRDDAEAVVRGFLRDVRSGERPERAGRYLAARVRAHQGRPGAEHGVVTRTPEDYADHVRDMLRARGPWTFEVTGVEASDGYVEARWRQAGAVAAEGSARRRPVVEHGWARYRVRDGRIDEYWIDAREQAAPAPGEVLRYTAFSTDPGGGNPAGVVLDATGMTDAQMLATAAGVGFSETAFLLPGPDPVGVRYFSPRAEVSFCGHATIATAVAVAERSGAGRMRLATAAGQVEVVTDRADDGTWRATLTSVPPRTAPLEDADLRGLLSALRWSEADLDPGLPPRVAYAGAWHPVLAARTRARLRDLDYDREALADLMARRGWTTVDLVWRQDATTFVARNPFPPGGVVEDPATGAAAAALGGYLREGGHVGLPAVLTVRQGEDMGRPSVLTVEVPEDPGSGIRVSGSAVALPAAG